MELSGRTAINRVFKAMKDEAGEPRPEEQKNPLTGRWTLISVIAVVVIGMGSLLIFLTPTQIIEAFEDTKPHELGISMIFFVLGCWFMSERWRACFGYRAGRWEAVHTMGVANTGNILIPGRLGEPLRIYLLARLGVPAEYGTSALVQERLADWIFRAAFVAAAISLTGMENGEKLGSRLVGITLVSLAVGSLVVLIVRRRVAISRRVSKSLGKLPKLREESVQSFVLRLLNDLAECWTHPGGKAALFWGLVAWIAWTYHTKFVLDSFFPAHTLAMACLIQSFTPATAPTQPGLFHGMAVAGMMVLGADKVLALQAAVVIHMIQMLFMNLWGVFSWFAIDRRLKRMTLDEPPEAVAEPAVEQPES